ncbi:HipA family kinase [Phaeovulum sp. W22_SRMD_FR3]|uniref:HipA family kinase n=1 Tax=Phaeovulum sp. W22_SRMD_FR3 TaxID=3240274 RepID=UPI003F9A95D0
MAAIETATVLLGATGFNVGNVNDTYRGQVLLNDRKIRQAIIKDLELPQLCNELLAFCLARLVGLPVPDCFLGLARPEVMPASKAPSFEDGSRLVFVSADVKVPNVTFRLKSSNPAGQLALLNEIAEWSDLGRLYAFDAWIANIDRHPGNFLFGNPGDTWLIDHGHCFSGPAWRPEDLNPASDFVNRLSEWMTPFLSSVQKRERKAEATAFETALRGFSATEPSESSRITQLLPVECISALKAFLEARTAQISRQTSIALGIPVLV